MQELGGVSTGSYPHAEHSYAQRSGILCCVKHIVVGYSIGEDNNNFRDSVGVVGSSHPGDGLVDGHAGKGASTGISLVLDQVEKIGPVVSVVSVFLVGIAVEVDGHDAEIIVGLSHIGLHKFKSMCEIGSSYAA